MVNPSLGRRSLLIGGLAAAATASLSACAGGTPGQTTTTAAGSASAGTAENPFNVAKGSTVDAVIFNGGYKTDYVDFAAEKMKAKSDVTGKVSPSTQIAQELQPRFAGGNPPDLVDNSGAGAIGIGTLVEQLEDLTSVLNANNYEGKKIADTVYGDALKLAGTYNNKLVAMNYAMTVYAVWYSASLFKENGWTPPKTYADLMDLGAKAKAKGKFLFCFGKEAASYYLTMMLCAAIKEGGQDVMDNFNKMKPDCFAQKTVVDVFKAMEDIIKAGYMKPGGSGTQFTAAQAQWSQAQEAILYPSGGWIENEMKSQTKAGFEMTGIPEPMLSANPKMKATSVHATAGEPFIVPSKGKNVAGGKELLRAMLSKEAATNFAKTRLALTVVKDTVPEDGFGSTALKSQAQLLKDAGTDTFHWRFIEYYGFNRDTLPIMGQFLEGQIGADAARQQLQAIVDRVIKDWQGNKLA